MNKRAVGARYEKMACEYLRKSGYVIVEQNFHCRTGEIDVVAWEGNVLVFVEVKYRKNLAMGSPLEAVDPRKQKNIRRIAAVYLYQKGFPEQTDVRFDVVGILDKEITLIRNAF